MGAEREDTDPNPKRVGTEPGLGKGSVPKPAVADAADTIEEDEPPPPVDFDALHAALGDPMRYDELPHESDFDGSASHDAVDELLEDDVSPGHRAPPVPAAATGKGARVGESSGRSSATYASARPHTIPPTRTPSEDLNAPPVIVATDDTVPSAPPQMTVPLTQPTPGPPPGAPYAASAMPGYGTPARAAPISHPGYPAGPRHPSSGSHPNATPALTPQPFPTIPRGGPQMTMRMPDRPINPRRGKTPTIVVRPRGPTPKQQLVAFVLLTLMILGAAVGYVFVYQPHMIGLGPPVPSAAPLPPVPPAPTSVGPTGASSVGTGAASVAPATATASASATPSATSSSAPSAAASASAPRLKALRPVVPTPPAPATTAPPAGHSGTNPNAHF